MSLIRGLGRTLKLQHILFAVLVLSGIIPLVIICTLFLARDRNLLMTQENSYLTRSAESLSLELDAYLRGLEGQLEQLGFVLLALPEPASLEARLRGDWIAPYLDRMMRANPQLLSLRVLSLDGQGPRLGVAGLPPEADRERDAVLRAAIVSGRPEDGLVVLPGTGEPLATLAVPIVGPDDRVALYVDALARLSLIDTVLDREDLGDVSVYLIDRHGRVLWSRASSRDLDAAVQASDLLRDFARLPLALTREYTLSVAGRAVQVLARVSPVAATGWGVVVQKPSSSAYPAVDEMIWNSLLVTALVVLLSLLSAGVVARGVARPMGRLAETSQQIAAGRLGERVEERVLGAEIASLAESFNRMSDHLERRVEDLRRAAHANRELFIGTIRSFAAVIDAKDPYTRGHSERVANYSRAIARQLGLPEDLQQRVWLGALLHDVGKIGIEDRVLQKGGQLSNEEFEQMKLHPIIGAEILSEIEQLRPVIPAIRWHHEAWNGEGYPDGLKGEEIPLLARVVAVGDCFDAVTTHRPYQQGYTQQFAVETIKRLAGKRFDASVVSAFLRAFEAGEIQDQRRVTFATSRVIDAQAAFSI